MKVNALRNASDDGLDQRLELDNKREGFRVAWAMGVSLSAAKLVLCIITENQWPRALAIGREDLQIISDQLRPPSPELTAYLKSNSSKGAPQPSIDQPASSPEAA